MRCHNCRTIDSYRRWRGTMTLRGVEFVARGERCRTCGEIVFDSKEVRRQERLVASGLVGRGIRNGRDFQFVRKIAGIRANELATLLDVRPETVSRWESGDVALPRSTAFILGELYEHPKTARQKLERLAS